MNKKIRFGIWIMTLLFAAALLGGCGKDKSKEEKVEVSSETDEEVNEEPLVIDSEEELVEDNEVYEAVELVELENAIAEMLGERVALGEKWAVYVEDLTDQSYAIVGNDQMQSASIIKLFTAGSVFQNLETLKSNGYSEDQVQELVSSMIRVSDNDANNSLVNMLGAGDKAAGFSAVNHFAEDIGCVQTHMGRYMLEQNPPDDNYTSVVDEGRLLGKIYRGEISGADAILEYMKRQERRWKIPAGLPQGAEVANKTGELSDVENDVAIVFTDKGDYILCVMSENVTGVQDAQKKISDLSGLVYSRMMNK